MKSKLLLVCAMIFTGLAAQANPDAEDMAAILTNQTVLELVGNTRIESVINKGLRSYQITFATCVADLNVRSVCAPMPGGPCTTEVVVVENSVRCRYERVK